MRTTQRVLSATAIVLAIFIPSVATGQPAPGAIRIGGLVSGSIGAGTATPTVGVSASYRATRFFAVEGDLTRLSDVTLFDCVTTRTCGPDAFTSAHARAAVATVNVVAELPTGVSWLHPYLAAGGGAARVRREILGGFRGGSMATSRTEPVFNVGGGVDFVVWRGLALGLDARYQRVYEDQRIYRPNLRNLTRVGSVVSYRF